MNRVVKVARMQLINKWSFLGIPMVILVASTLMTFAIWALLPASAREGTLYSGSGQAVMWYFLALGIQSLTFTFPFSQAMSVSRRTFYLGTLGLFATIALGYAILYYLLGLVEKATGGWGFNGQLFALGWIAGNNAAIQILFYFVAMVLLFMIGFWAATVYMRWKATGLLIAGIGFAVVLLGLVGLATLNDAWPQVGAWFAAMQVLGLSIVLGGLCVLLAGGSYLTLRRATT
ncbi:hypothetical protein GCM10009715_05000 [Paeniglutamicibacter psychrophenolicus]|uniref:ABC transporter permease n=1 Tax=Paeniglutamicibacter psychrophenolicus TaxID=257454 RepID=A0ABS4WDL5_9MICC|nr:hypothetical protein [Paeniglutamicibacter psychrophenolicus]MBP2374299.1 hypothetical protein [Paeniglutamicibacter psychrophenolicus]